MGLQVQNKWYTCSVKQNAVTSVANTKPVNFTSPCFTAQVHCVVHALKMSESLLLTCTINAIRRGRWSQEGEGQWSQEGEGEGAVVSREGGGGAVVSREGGRGAVVSSGLCSLCINW